MGGLVTLSLLLQDGVGEGAGDQSGAGTGAGGGILSLLPLFVILWFIVYVMMIRPQRKQQNQHQQMLSSLKKNDLVRTSGGIYGKVVSVEPDRDLVVLKVDESNNVRLKVARSAIADVIDEKEKAPA
ncbi:MAG TPA: preprotein translocase subunit YajC [Planctomycetes bacterium]|nr:preprotein translocase subunit YajC [Planctomycetota bacterium]HIN79710.1 preprotein translocase subunit YajC [Planctomycetota bacterium]